VREGEEWKAEVLAKWAGKSVEQMTSEGLFEWEVSP